MNIKHKDGRVLYSCDAETLREAVKAAVAEKINLSDAYLGGADLSDAYLSGAYLRGAHLSGAHLSGADLRGAYLRGADLRGADLSGADLRGADLRGADLRGADLSGAHLIDAGQDSRGYRFIGVRQKIGYHIFAGCHTFTPEEARTHWESAHKDDPALRAECLAKIALIEAVAKARGWA